jgi:hypothetical protein
MANPVTVVPALGYGLLMSQTGPSAGYSAVDDRRQFPDLLTGEGVSTYESFRVQQRGAGANMSVDIGQDERAWIRGDSIALQGSYCVPPSAATLNVDVPAASASNPRLDLVVLEALDDAHDVGGLSLARVRVVAGTPTSGSTLDNRTGAAALPASSLHLADILVAISDTSITTAEIRDRRAFIAGVPPLLTDVDMVAFEPAPLLTLASFSAAPQDLQQSAVLVRLPRRIVSATRIRWRYKQGAGTALAGNYLFAIHDASGRQIVSTGGIAFTGATSSGQQRSETIAATTLEPGWYYLLFGVDSTNAGTFDTLTWHATSTNAPYPNAALASATGGVTAPTTVLAFTDAGATNATPDVPVCALSVG